MDAFPTPRDPLIGTRLDGRYLITGVLGRGGMGIVYDGVHEGLGRPVAIKVLSSAIAAEQVVVQRFLREAQIAAGLGHGNIVDVSDLGRLSDGRPYLVMPKITGISFADLLARNGPQSPARVVDLLRGVASALDLVHAKKLVHRDVKPENLMFVTREDGSETVMLMDFGIATLISPATVRLTGEGVVCGTPAYIAPESARGEDADHRADVYALATVAFELLAGELPFDAANPLRILPMKAFRDPPKLSERCDRSFPEPVEAVIARGLARVPEERFETAGAFVRALELAINPSAARTSLPTTQVPASTRPPRITESLELPAGSSDELELDAAFEAADAQPIPSAPPVSPDLALLEEMATRLTPRSEPPAAAATEGEGQPGQPAALQGAESSSTEQPASAAAVEALAAEVHGRASDPDPEAVTGEALVRPSRRRWFAVVAATAFVGAGLVFAAVWPDPPPPPAAPPAAAQPSRTAEPSAPPPEPQPPPSVPATAPAAAEPVQGSPPEPDVSPEPSRERVPRGSPRARPTRASGRGSEAAATAPSSSTVAASAQPTADELNKQAGQALLQGHLARASELFAQATERDPRSAAAWRGYGLTSERLGRTREAIRAYKRALQLAPTGPKADSVRARLEQLE